MGQRKAGKHWVRYAYWADLRRILAFQVGKRNDATCKKLFNKLKGLQIDHFYTDDWRSYKKHIPTHKHVISNRPAEAE